MEKEYIEREAAKNAIFEYICSHTMSKFPSAELLRASKMGAEGALNEIDDVPTADVAEVKHGEWVRSGRCDHVPYRIKNPEKWVTYRCSVCGYRNGRRSNDHYCPNCGAKMDGVRKENEDDKERNT